MKKIITFEIIMLCILMIVSSSTGFNLKMESTITNVEGNILYVGGSGPGNYSKIQDAINDSYGGDTVFVYNDSSPYYENVIIDKSINLVGENRDETVIEGNVSKDVIYISADWVNISEFTIRNGYDGININSDSNTIKNNKIIFNYHYGINSRHSRDNKIAENIISNNFNGIHPSYFYDSSIVYNIISNNTGSNIFFRSNNNTINNNLISNNVGGLVISISCNNTIAYNKIVSSEYNGIVVTSNSSNNFITNNNIISNNNYGIRFSHSSDNNSIYHNNFINNTQNAYDECNNIWDDDYPFGGNYWDDYTGNDSDEDGIGDTPYPIPGGNNEDRYPLMVPYIEKYFGTMSPICPFLNIAEVNLLDGNASQIQEIEKMLNNRILQFIIPQLYYINVTGLDFTVSFNKKIPNFWFLWKFKYSTVLIENDNLTLVEKPHTVRVNGLNGIFAITRGQPFRLNPPQFIFAGTYDEVIIEYPT